MTIGQNIEGYRVMEYCKTYGLNNAESYKVVGPDGRPALMKIILDGCYSAEFTEEVCDLMKVSIVYASHLFICSAVRSLIIIRLSFVSALR